MGGGWAYKVPALLLADTMIDSFSKKISSLIMFTQLFLDYKWFRIGFASIVIFLPSAQHCNLGLIPQDVSLHMDIISSSFHTATEEATG